MEANDLAVLLETLTVIQRLVLQYQINNGLTDEQLWAQGDEASQRRRDKNRARIEELKRKLAEENVVIVPGVEIDKGPVGTEIPGPK